MRHGHWCSGSKSCACWTHPAVSHPLLTDFPAKNEFIWSWLKAKYIFYRCCRDIAQVAYFDPQKVRPGCPWSALDLLNSLLDEGDGETLLNLFILSNEENSFSLTPSFWYQCSRTVSQAPRSLCFYFYQVHPELQLTQNNYWTRS